METNSELWQLDARIGPTERGDRKLRTGRFEELVERVKLPTLPDGTYEVRSASRRCVFGKTGNTVVVIKDVAG
jgi:hypothetical protein